MPQPQGELHAYYAMHCNALAAWKVSSHATTLATQYQTEATYHRSFKLAVFCHPAATPHFGGSARTAQFARFGGFTHHAHRTQAVLIVGQRT